MLCSVQDNFRFAGILRSNHVVLRVFLLGDSVLSSTLVALTTGNRDTREDRHSPRYYCSFYVAATTLEYTVTTLFH